MGGGGSSIVLTLHKGGGGGGAKSDMHKMLDYKGDQMYCMATLVTRILTLNLNK